MPKILIADDDENISLLYKEELEEEGYEVEIAKNGRECLEKIKSFDPELIVMDIRMPEMDGIEALGRVIAGQKNVPIVLNTAYSSYKDDFRSWGADAYVVKSSDMSELKAVISQLISGKKPKRGKP